MIKLGKSLPALALIGLYAGSAQAEFSLNGFATLGVAEVKGDDRRFGQFGEYTDDLRTDAVTRGGLQGSYRFNDQFSFTGQLLLDARRNSYEVEPEWAYLSYQATDALELRTGRLRLPAFLLSESLDVGYSQPWIRPPIEVYSQVPSSRYVGADLLYNMELGGYDTTLQVMFGRTDDDIFVNDIEVELEGRDVWGVSMTLHYDYGRIRLGHIAGDFEVDTNITALVETSPVTSPGVFDPVNLRNDLGIILEDLDSTFTSLGYTYENGNWVSYGEYAIRDVDDSGIRPLPPLLQILNQHF